MNLLGIYSLYPWRRAVPPQTFTTRHSNRKFSIVMALTTTFTQCAPETTKFGKITQNKGHFAVQGHSRSPILVPIESSYATSYQWLILTTVRRRSRRTFSTHFEIFWRRFDGVVIYFFNYDFKFFDDASEFSVILSVFYRVAQKSKLLILAVNEIKRELVSQNLSQN